MRCTSEFDQTHKQAENKIQVPEKISGNNYD